MAQRYDSSARRKPLSDAEFTRKLYEEGSLTREEMSQTQQTGTRKPLSDAAFERRMRVEETGKKGQARHYPGDTPVLRQGTIDDVKNRAWPPRKMEYTIPEVVASIPNTLLSSGTKFLGDLGDAVSHPVATIGNAINIVRGFAGSEEHRPASDAVREHFKERYGDWESAKRTVAEDPVGFLGDASMGVTGLGIGSRAGALAAKTAGKASALGKQAFGKGKTVTPGGFEKGAAAVGGKLDGASKSLHGLAGKIDPVAAPVSAVVKELQQVVEGINSPLATTSINKAAKIPVPISKLNTGTQAAATGNAAVQREQKKKHK